MNVVDYANAGFVTENEQESANLERSIKVYKVLCDVWHHSEGISRDEMKVLCGACGIDSRAVIGDDPQEELSLTSDPQLTDINLPF